MSSPVIFRFTARRTGQPGQLQLPVSLRPRSVFLVALVAFFLIGAGWSMALPANGTNDENEHIIRAYGAASGQLYSSPVAATRGGGAWFDVPRSLLPVNTDCPQRWELPASCMQRPPDDPSRVRLPSAAGRYNPLYYVPVGLPMVLSPNMTGIVLGRMVSAAMTAVLLASALTIAFRRRSPLLLATMLLAATPNLLNLAGSVNPSGLELAAGVLVWTALLELVRAREGELDERWTARLLFLAGVSGAILISIRTLGPVLLGLSVLACAAIARRGRVRTLLARRDLRTTGYLVAAAGVYGVAWSIFSGVLNNPPAEDPPPHLSFAEKLAYIVTDRLTQWVAQVVGRFSYGEIQAPNAMLVIWYGLALVLIIPTLLLATRRQAAVLLGVVALSIALLVGFELAYYQEIGWAQQSRYVLPFGVGALLIAGFLRRWERTLGWDASRRFLLGTVLITGVMHFWALAVVMTRFQVGQRFKAVGALHGSWLPAVGPELPLISVGIGGVLLVALAILNRNREERPTPDPVPAARALPAPHPRAESIPTE